MSGPANVRDVGGLPLDGGGTVRSGVLLRGDALYDGDDVPLHVPWPPTTVVDLRSAVERARSPYVWPSSTVVVARELFDAGDLSKMPRYGELLDVYRAMMAHAGPSIAALAGVIADGGTTYLHCSAGKDRTGATVAALLLLAGVTEDAVIEDYRRTEQHMELVLARLTAHGVLGQGSWLAGEWASAPEAAVRVVVEELQSEPRGARGWFRRHGASDEAIARYRDAMRTER